MPINPVSQRVDTLLSGIKPGDMPDFKKPSFSSGYAQESLLENFDKFLPKLPKETDFKLMDRAYEISKDKVRLEDLRKHSQQHKRRSLLLTAVAVTGVAFTVLAITCGAILPFSLGIALGVAGTAMFEITNFFSGLYAEKKFGLRKVLPLNPFFGAFRYLYNSHVRVKELEATIEKRQTVFAEKIEQLKKIYANDPDKRVGRYIENLKRDDKILEETESREFQKRRVTDKNLSSEIDTSVEYSFFLGHLFGHLRRNLESLHKELQKGRTLVDKFSSL